MLLRVMKNNTERVTMTRAKPAHTVAHVDAVKPAAALHRAVVHGKHHGVALAQRHHLGP